MYLYGRHAQFAISNTVNSLGILIDFDGALTTFSGSRW
jgi:hypothetical protein